ncbi:spike base protein, RCAP_Rcc01079 family [Erythrobacter tepidarius]|uniref:spike base protein, RCAP_Rcc01079 family n=1 Tax=Erythrobacter tepidarius TaxID=60454 RepID=UPI00146BFDA4|nr:hypothetical protein [Erythrobacter tepidarius]
MADHFSTAIDSLIAPARLAFAIVPADTSDLPQYTKAIYVGTGGDIALRAVGSDEDVVLRNVASGSVLAIRVAALRQTGTTASDIVGLA